MTDVLKDGEVDFFIQVNLPFPPFIGLSLCICNETHYVIKTIEYDVDDREFSVYLHSDSNGDGWCHCKPSDQCCVLTDSLIESYVKQGWFLLEVRRGTKRHFKIEGQFD